MWPWDIKKQLTEISNKLDILIKETKMSDVTIDQILADATQESSVISSVQTAIASLQSQLASALSGVTIPSDVQTKMNSIFSTMTGNDTALAALAAGTPVTPAQLTATPAA